MLLFSVTVAGFEGKVHGEKNSNWRSRHLIGGRVPDKWGGRRILRRILDSVAESRPGFQLVHHLLIMLPVLTTQQPPYSKYPLFSRYDVDHLLKKEVSTTKNQVSGGWSRAYSFKEIRPHLGVSFVGSPKWGLLQRN